MRESTGYPAITIHKALCLTEDETFGTPNEEMMQEEMVIVDETTMVDMNLARVLFSKVLDGTRLVLVGDADQLPSVGPGNVFTELIASGVIPTTYLDISYRQKDGSGIIGNAEKINSGNTKLKFGKDFQFIRANTAQEAAEEIKSLVKRLVDNGKSVDDIQILSPVKKQEDVGVYALNTAMQEMFNPPAADKAELVVGKETFRVGDKVMQMVNLEEVSNGDIGTVMKIWRCEGKDAMSVLFSEERMEIYTDENLDQLVHAYALTVHKSQGGEYPIVIMPVLQVFRRMLKRNVLYTGVTRASETVYLVGTTSALVMAIHANDAKRRNTMLASRVQEEAERINAGNKAA